MTEPTASKTSEVPDLAVPTWAAPLIATVAQRWRTLALALGLIGSLLLLLAWIGPLPRTGLAGFLGCYLLLYAALVTLQGDRLDWIGPRLRRRLAKAVVSRGVGFYGCMTLARFSQLELHSLVQSFGEFEFSRSQLAGLAMEWFTGFSQESLRNSIDAFIWPARLIGDHGLAIAGMVTVGCWLLYALGARAFPALHQRIQPDPHS